METESENSNFKIGQNDHSNPYIESTTVLSDIYINLLSIQLTMSHAITQLTMSHAITQLTMSHAIISTQFTMSHSKHTPVMSYCLNTITTFSLV